MTRPTLNALVIPHEDGRITVAAPGPGMVTLSVRAGESVVAGSTLGILERDEQSYGLVMPRQGSGQVKSVELQNPWTACEHAQPLLTLGRVQSGRDEDESAAAGTDGSEGGADSGVFEIHAPTHGTFYRRPTPGEPAYVEPGARVEHGQTIGLVEVMKFFSPITYQPPDGNSSGIVREIAADDGDEVRGGQLLFRIELR